MDGVLLVIRLILAAVFALAGVTKLADLARSRQAMRVFGVPERLASPLGVGLPFAELAIAVLLLPVTTAWWGALGALLLLGAFIAGIAWNMARGRSPECHCFGQVHSEPIGKPTLVRNGVLALLAAGTVAQGPDGAGASVTGWWNDLSGGERAGITIATLALTVGVGLAWLAFHLLQQNGRLLLRIEALEARLGEGSGLAQPGTAAPATGLAMGSAAPDFRLPSLTGTDVSLADLRAAGRPVLLVFTDPGCGPCMALLPEASAWQEEHAERLTVAVISRGTAEANRAKIGDLSIAPVLLQSASEISDRYSAKATPSAVLVGADGRVASTAALGAESIRSLVTIATQPILSAASASGNGHGAATPRPATSPVGSLAPEVTLPGLDGAPKSLTDFRGESTLVLFWNPHCWFCNRMLDDLKAWEAEPPADAPRLLVVSTGSVEDNRAMGLRSTVVLDQGFVTGRAFGAGGTPSAVLVDTEGKLASGVAVGADAVLALANGSGATQPA
jgi:peroxiredoxin/uncharacterized membrane protein YphA (DoxX/SURF4 family)